LAPFSGDCGVGAVAFSVEPSGLAFASPGIAALGDAGGVGVDFPHAAAIASTQMTTGTNENLRFMSILLQNGCS
jgi:hypothetical protein